MRKNRFPLIVPCHRVLASGGKIGGYSAAEGLTMKRRLLDMEQSDRFATSIANKFLSAAMSD
jgi:methylated-DNA-[protein]-cysteine S-methyltransferase